MLNSSLEFVDKQTRVQRNNRSLLDDEEFAKVVGLDEEEESTKEEPQEEVRGFMTPVEDASEEPIIPTIIDEDKASNEVKEKLRVVEIIPISDSVKEKEEEQDFMVNDFEDDDYVDLDSAISKVEEN